MNCKVIMRRHLLTGKGSAEHKTMNVLHILKQSTPNIIYAGMLVRQWSLFLKFSRNCKTRFLGINKVRAEGKLNCN